MNVTDLPVPATRELYDEAFAKYADLVRSRSYAVYRVGNVRYPGLSDIDLIVVTDRTNIDNKYFYSAMQRMPRKYLPLFLHEPFILPVWSLRVMQYTTHAEPKLLAGRDVIKPYAPSQEPSERWCRMLEGYCSYLSFSARVRKDQTLRGRMTVAVASAFRYVLRDGSQLFSGIDAAGYEETIDRMRAHFFDGGDLAANVEAMWRQFSGEFESFGARLREWLGAHDDADALRKARAVLRGDEERAELDREYAFIRARDIDGYHQELGSLGLPYGHLFFVAAHPNAVQAPPEAPVGNLVRQLYRVQRRLSEYSARA